MRARHVLSGQGFRGNYSSSLTGIEGDIAVGKNRKALGEQNKPLGRSTYQGLGLGVLTHSHVAFLYGFEVFHIFHQVTTSKRMYV